MAPQPKSKMIVLKISKEGLSKWPSDSTPALPSSPSSSAVDSTAPQTAGANTPDPTAAASKLLAPPADSLKRKGIPGPKPGMKRNASQLTIDGVPKPRGKPGPKKKMRVEGPNGTLVPVNAPKLNPKASAGAINANLRALDRTGKPCRRWHRTPFQLKSFTGSVWTVPGAWGAPKRPAPAVDENGTPVNGVNGVDKSDNSATASDLPPKAALDSSAVPSEKSTTEDVKPALPLIQENGISPVPIAA